MPRFSSVKRLPSLLASAYRLIAGFGLITRICRVAAGKIQVSTAAANAAKQIAVIH
jgi:hypothetical protein